MEKSKKKCYIKNLLFSLSLFFPLTFSTPLFSQNPTYHERTYRPHRSNYAEGVQRNRYGKIARDTLAKKEFMIMTGYPKGRPGYVIDHIVPLKRGGADHPDNMQWQTRGEAKEKDKWE